MQARASCLSLGWISEAKSIEPTKMSEKAIEKPDGMTSAIEKSHL